MMKKKIGSRKVWPANSTTRMYNDVVQPQIRPTLRNAFLFVRFSSRVLPYAKKIVYRNRVPDFKNNLSVCDGSIATSLYNPLGGAYYRSYGCSSINPRHSAKTAVACTLQLNKINLTSTKQRIT